MSRRGRAAVRYACSRGACLLFACLAAAACDGRFAGFPGNVTGGDPAPRQVVFLSAAPIEALPAEEGAAWAWLQGREEFRSRFVQFVDLPNARLPSDSILWWHYAGEAALPSISGRRESLAAVRQHLRSGGSLLLSLIAASYTVPLEIESAPPDMVERDAPELTGGAEVSGLQSAGHPVLARFRGGALPAADPGYRPAAAVAYSGARWPAEGKVWAVHKGDDTVDPSVKIGIEYPDVFGAGGAVLTLGAHTYFADGNNRNRAQLELLFLDALRYLDRQEPAAPPGAAAPDTTDARDSGDAAAGATGTGATPRYWPAPPSAFVETTVPAGELPPVADPQTTLNLLERARSGIETRRFDDRADFTLAVPRAAVSGSQLGRIDELRLHPRVVIRDLRLGIVRTDRGVTWLDTGTGSRSFTARPEGDEIHYTDGETEVTVHLTVDRRYSALVLLIAIRSPAAVDVIAAWQAGVHGGMSSAAEAGTPRIGWDPGAQALVWRDERFVVKGGFGRATPHHRIGFSAENDLDDGGLSIGGDEVDADPTGEPVDAEAAAAAQPADPSRVALQVRVDPGRPALLPLVFVGGVAGELNIDRVFAELVAAPARPWVDNAVYYRDFLGPRTMGLLAPDRGFEDAFKWAKVGVEALRGEVDGLGEGLFTALGGSGAVWTAPPNAFGGSGSLWATMAADAYGDRDAAAATLRLLARHQGVDGRIPDAVSPTAGTVENGLAATALYLIALDNHLRTWGDAAFLEELWPSAQRAAEHLLSADLDGDGLIDAVSRQDRWSNDPTVRTPIDLAALSAAAWLSTVRLATAMNDTGDLGARSAAAVELVRPLLNGPFWDPNERRFNFAKRADGTFVPIATVLPAVPIIFNLLDAGSAGAALDAFSSSAFSRDWGVGLVASPATAGAETGSTAQSPPGGLPSAAADVVSPVFTGWTALAAFGSHRPEAGFAHTLTNLLLLQHGNPGYATPAFDRVGFAPRGSVDQAAAAQAMTLLPVVWGVLGIRPDALNRRIDIAPRLPAGWNRVNVDQVRVGNSEFRLQIRKDFNQTQYRVDNWLGSRDVVLTFTAEVPADVSVALDASVVGFEVLETIDTEDTGHRRTSVSVRTAGDAEASVLTFNHDPFPRLVPPPQLTARPDQASGGLRIVRTRYLGGVLTIHAEGLPGETYALTVATPWNVQQVTGVPGVGFTNPEPGLAMISEVTVPGSGNRYRPFELEVTFAR